MLCANTTLWSVRDLHLFRLSIGKVMEPRGYDRKIKEFGDAEKTSVSQVRSQGEPGTPLGS